MNKQDEEKAKELYPDFERDLLYQNRVKKLQRKAFIQGAAWKQEQMIERGISFIKEVCKLNNFDDKILVTNFKKAMEED